MEEALVYLKDKINVEDTVIVACSAGPDSMCLLSLVEKIGAKIICAHVDHGVRKEAKEEYVYLENYCNKQRIIFEGLVLNNLSTINFEETARKKRYAFLEKLLEKYSAKYILTAHHADDQIETILMRLTRGSNLSGYVGIRKEDGNYLRPLLEVSKEEILAYLEHNNIKYYLDYTNDTDEHTRNRYRQYIVPYLKKENPNVHQKYLEFSNELLAYDTFVRKYVDNLGIIKNREIDLKAFLKQDKFIQMRIIEKLIRALQLKDTLDVSKKNVEDIITLAKSDQSNSQINLKNGYVAKKKYEMLTIEKNKETLYYNQEFSQEFQTDMFIIKQVEESLDDSNYIIRLDSKEIKLPLYIRTRREKDVMEVKNLGHKKLKDIFIDSKIDLESRDAWPILVDSDNNILWMPGLKKSKFAKDKREKYDIILSSERKRLDE